MRHIYLTIIFLTIHIAAFCQLNTTVVNNATALAQALVGPGVKVTNAVLNCPQGAAGTFTATGTNLGLADGIILTSGLTQIAEGPNNSESDGHDQFAAGDMDLDLLINDITYDACILEFDIETVADTLQFSYVFGSEEYPEFVFQFYNDAFAFFISGPGITGQKNIATIPGTNSPVSIDNVNEDYSPNCINPGPGCTNCAYYVNNCNGTTIQYDGFTTVLPAKVAVQPCQTYHLKLVIADVGDGIYDSGILIKGKSLSGGNAIVSSDTAICIGESVQLVATGGTSYQWFPAASLSDPTAPDPIATPTVSTLYSVVVNYPGGCTDTLLVNVDVSSGHVVDAGTDTTIDEGQIVILSGSTTAVSYSWSPATGLSDPNILNPTASPENTTTYYLTTTDDIGCKTVDSVTIVIIKEDLVAIPNAFTPNNDGMNDYFNLLVTGEVKIETFRIYNRWGELIYEGNNTVFTDQLNQNVGWDGKYKDEDQPPGVYTYVFVGTTREGERILKKGNLTLLR